MIPKTVADKLTLVIDITFNLFRAIITPSQFFFCTFHNPLDITEEEA
jgi:hypothetical protein